MEIYHDNCCHNRSFKFKTIYEHTVDLALRMFNLMLYYNTVDTRWSLHVIYLTAMLHQWLYMYTFMSYTNIFEPNSCLTYMMDVDNMYIWQCLAYGVLAEHGTTGQSAIWLDALIGSDSIVDMTVGWCFAPLMSSVDHACSLAVTRLVSELDVSSPVGV